MKKPRIKRLICALCVLMACLTAAPIQALAASAVLTDEEVQQRIAERVESSSTEITVMSFNVAGPWGNALGNLFGIRPQAAAEVIAQVLPDSFGTQEMNYVWEEFFEELLPFYDYYGVERGGDSDETKREKNTIYWLKDKYTAVDMGTFWLSETPDVESQYEGAGCNRVCTWVLLEDINTGMRYLHMNTHLDNASDEARNYGAQVIVNELEKILETYPDVPVILTGDFNSTAGSMPYNTLTAAGFEDLYVTAETSENMCSYHDWGAYSIDSGNAIDFIFALNIESASVCRVMTETDTTVSDHFPVMAVIDLGEDAIPEDYEGGSTTGTEPATDPEGSTQPSSEEEEERTTAVSEESATSTASGEAVETTTAADETTTAAADSSSASSQETSPNTGASGTAALAAALFSAAAALFVIGKKRLAA